MIPTSYHTRNENLPSNQVPDKNTRFLLIAFTYSYGFRSSKSVSQFINGNFSTQPQKIILDAHSSSSIIDILKEYKYLSSLIIVSENTEGDDIIRNDLIKIISFTQVNSIYIFDSESSGYATSEGDIFPCFKVKLINRTLSIKIPSLNFEKNAYSLSNQPIISNSKANLSKAQKIINAIANKAASKSVTCFELCITGSSIEQELVHALNRNNVKLGKLILYSEQAVLIQYQGDIQQSLQFILNSESMLADIQSLNFKRIQFDSTAASLLANKIKNNTTISELSLASSTFASSEDLSEILKRCESISSIDLSEIKLSSDTYNDSCKPAIIKQLIQLVEFQALAQISLEYLSFENNELLPLFSALNQNQCELQILKLKGNFLTTSEIQELISFAQKTSSLIQTDLDDINVGYRGMRNFIRRHSSDGQITQYTLLTNQLRSLLEENNNSKQNLAISPLEYSPIDVSSINLRNFIELIYNVKSIHYTSKKDIQACYCKLKQTLTLWQNEDNTDSELIRYLDKNALNNILSTWNANKLEPVLQEKLTIYHDKFKHSFSLSFRNQKLPNDLQENLTFQVTKLAKAILESQNLDFQIPGTLKHEENEIAGAINDLFTIELNNFIDDYYNSALPKEIYNDLHFDVLHYLLDSWIKRQLDTGTLRFLDKKAEECLYELWYNEQDNEFDNLLIDKILILWKGRRLPDDIFRYFNSYYSSRYLGNGERRQKVADYLNQMCMQHYHKDFIKSLLGQIIIPMELKRKFYFDLINRENLSVSEDIVKNVIFQSKNSYVFLAYIREKTYTAILEHDIVDNIIRELMPFLPTVMGYINEQAVMRLLSSWKKNQLSPIESDLFLHEAYPELFSSFIFMQSLIFPSLANLCLKAISKFGPRDVQLASNSLKYLDANTLTSFFQSNPSYQDYLSKTLASAISKEFEEQHNIGSRISHTNIIKTLLNENNQLKNENIKLKDELTNIRDRLTAFENKFASLFFFIQDKFGFFANSQSEDDMVNNNNEISTKLEL